MTPPEARIRSFATLAGFLVVALVLLVLRRPDGVTNPQLWAEDAVVFHAHADAFGIASLVMPNAGYFHLGPRVVALLARLIDPAFTPHVYNGAALLVALAVAVAILRSRLPGGRPVAAGCAFAFLLVPHYSHEVFLNLTNIQWVLISYLILVLVREPPTSARAQTLTAAGVVIAGLTSPFSAALVPLAGWRMWRAETRAQRVVFGLMITTGLIQGFAAMSAGQTSLPGTAPTTPFHAGPAAWLGIFGFRGLIETLLPPALWPTDPGWPRVLAGVLLVGLLAALAALPGPGRTERIFLVVAIVLFSVITALRVRPYAIELPDRGWGDRYFMPLRVWLIWSILLLVPLCRGWWRAGPWLALAAFAVTAIPFYQGEAWEDFRWAEHVAPIRRGEPADIPINPSGWTYHYAGRAR